MALPRWKLNSWKAACLNHLACSSSRRGIPFFGKYVDSSWIFCYEYAKENYASQQLSFPGGGKRRKENRTNQNNSTSCPNCSFLVLLKINLSWQSLLGLCLGSMETELFHVSFVLLFATLRGECGSRPLTNQWAETPASIVFMGH